MNRTQAISLVQKTFAAAFDKGQFLTFIRNLLNRLDEGPDRQKRWSGQVIGTAFADKVSQYERLGTYTDPGRKKIDVLVIHLKKDSTLERGRTSLRNFVAHYLSSGHRQGKEAVLAAFVSPDKQNWRFSFVKLEYSLELNEKGLAVENKELTSARRSSFLVGETEKTHTAQKQFLTLLQNDVQDPTLGEIEQAFNIEPVTREFFEEYKTLFEKVRDALGQIAQTNPVIQAEFADKGIEVDDFAKKLLGQIVFLYFLQKKGWFGVERNGKWGEGRKDFLRYLFENRQSTTNSKDKSPKEINFFNDILEPLFYKALAHEPYYEDPELLFNCKIPFLNGGLFEPLRGYKWFQKDILLNDELFSNKIKTKDGDEGTGILDVFDRYNFTVNEAEPLEKEVAVDPEMLGKVFENLLNQQERHKGGTYYTPRVIVNSMCQQALINYLTARLPQVNQSDFEKLIRIGERSTEDNSHLPEGIRSNASEIDALLNSITICDPAIGSGAFAVGMMQEIIRARLILGSLFGQSERSVYKLKRHAIQWSLYGVDKDPGAVEIAKLRLWLSLMVDEDEIEHIQPLPNLDYKIMQGNSLFEEFKGIPLITKAQRDLITNDTNIKIREIEQEIKLIEKQLNYFGLNETDNKAKLQMTILEQRLLQIRKQKDQLRRSIAQTTGNLFVSESRAKLEELNNCHREFLETGSAKRKEELRQKIDQLEWEFLEAALTEADKLDELAELRKHRKDNRKDYFLWELNFAEVFQNKGGFDVIIANPPYVRQKEIKDYSQALNRNFTVHTGNADLYVYFYELGLKLLNRKGVLAFITQNKFFRAGYGNKIRELLGKQTRLDLVVDFGDKPVFDATAYPAIVILNKTPEPEHKTRVLNWDPADNLDTFEQRIADKGFNLSQQEFSPEGWQIEQPAVLRLLERLRSRGTPLGEYVQDRFYYGIKTGLNEAFVIDRATRDRLIAEHPSSAEIIKPFLRGRDVKRWQVEYADLWLIYVGWGLPIKKYPAVLAHLELFQGDLKKRPEVKQGRVPWYALSRYASDYWKEFEQPKIIYPDIAQVPQFALDENALFPDCTLFLIPSGTDYQLGILNSSVVRFFIKQIAPSVRGDFFRFKSIYVSQIPIPRASLDHQGHFSKFVRYLIFLKNEISHKGKETPEHALMLRYFEQIIDGMVYELFLPDELHARKREFFRPLAEEKLPVLESITGDKIKVIREVFERLFDKDHVIRQNIFFLNTLESVRIIEGKE